MDQLQSYTYSNTTQNVNSNISNFRTTSYGPNPNHPAYIFGKVIVRPTLDVGYNVCQGIYTLITDGCVAFDNLFSRMINFIPGARATATCDNKVPLSQQGAAVDPTKPQTAKIPQGRANLERQPLGQYPKVVVPVPEKKQERQPLSKKGQGGLF